MVSKEPAEFHKVQLLPHHHHVLILCNGLVSADPLSQAQLCGPAGHFSLVRARRGPARSLDPVKVRLVVHLQQKTNTWVLGGYLATIYLNKVNLSHVTYIALELVGLLGMLDVELLGVAGVVVELVAVGEVARLSLTLFRVQKLRLVGVDLVMGLFVLGLPLVLKVALEFAGCQRVHHLGVILDAAQPHLLALLLQMGLLVAALDEGEQDLTMLHQTNLSIIFPSTIINHFWSLGHLSE